VTTPTGNPAWLQSQLAHRTHTTHTTLTAAADQMNQCRTIADQLHTQGRQHQTDPTWQTAVNESHRLNTLAADHGHDIHDIGEEAARRRTHGDAL
jgi:hypothetical protein